MRHILLCRTQYWISALYSVNPDPEIFRLSYALSLSSTITANSSGRYRIEK
jgi:hypothetical protein